MRCWFAPEDVAGGKKLYEQIDQAIHVHDKLLLVLFEHSIGSEWVMTKIHRTCKAELSSRRPGSRPDAWRQIGLSPGSSHIPQEPAKIS